MIGDALRASGHAFALIVDHVASVDPYLAALGVILYLGAQAVRPAAGTPSCAPPTPTRRPAAAQHDGRLPRRRGAQRRHPGPRRRRGEALARAPAHRRRPLPDAGRDLRPGDRLRDPLRLRARRLGAGPGLPPRPRHVGGPAAGRRVAVPRASGAGHADHGRRPGAGRARGPPGAATNDRLRRARAPGPGHPGPPAALPHGGRLVAGARAPHPPGLAGGLHAGLRAPGDASDGRAGHGRPGRRADHPARPGQRGAAARRCCPTASSR